MDNETKAFFEKGNVIKGRYFKEVVNPLLQNAEPASLSLNGGHQLQSVEMTPVPTNSYIKHSVYEYKRDPLKFIHYTNLESAKSIIRSAIMRMYSLASMSDPQELSYVYRDTFPKTSVEKINEFKQNLFTLSMNEFQNEKEEINTWLDYGDCGKGVGIVLSFDKKEQSSWRQHYLSKIKYKEEDLIALKELENRHIEFSKKTPIQLIELDKNFRLPLAAFHKTTDFKKEKEVRLLVINFQDNQYEPIVVERKGEVTKSYIEFILNPSVSKEPKNNEPIPKIEKIILGPKIENFFVLIEELKELARRGLEYEIEVVKSKIDLNNQKLFTHF